MAEASSTSSAPDEPKISIVVATRQAATTIERCLESVLAQSHPAVDLIVIDGASTDGTIPIVERFAPRISFWSSGPDGSVYEAWNKALPHTKGDWICFLGADDRLADPSVLERMASYLQDVDRDVRVVYGRVEVVDADDLVIWRLGEPWPETRMEFREHMTIPHPGTFQHRSLFDDHGTFDPSFRIAGDYEFLLRELLDHDALFIPDVTVVRMGSEGLSHRPATAALMVRETHRARYLHGLVREPGWRSPAVYRSMLHAHIRRHFGSRAADRVGDAYRFLTRLGRR